MKSQKKYYLIFMFAVLTAHTFILSSLLSSSSNQPLHSEVSSKGAALKNKFIQTNFEHQMISVKDSAEAYKGLNVKNINLRLK